MFVDAGKVGPRARDLGLSHLHPDAGFGIRFRTRNITAARLDIARGAEGWYAVFRLAEPFHRKEGSSGFPLVAPFVP